MVPASIRRNLAGLRRRERLLTFVWGAACWLAIVLLLLFVCGLIDWLIDRQRDTPLLVRLGMFIVQGGFAFLAGLLFVLWPQVRRLSDVLLALWVEEKMPQFEHRLISAVQLNQPHADLQGMSKELVRVVTSEAEKQAQRVGGFAQVADHSRLLWTAGVLIPVLFVFALPFLIWPGVCFALLVRQLLPLSDTDVPHSVTLVSASDEFWPIGEEILIKIRVEGEWQEDMEGTVSVRPEGQPRDIYPLTYYEPTRDGKGAIFIAMVKPAMVDIRYSARLADGRTKAPSDMYLVPRPSVIDNQAWMLLPKYCGVRPNGEPYELQQGRGDVGALKNAGVRVQCETQKRVANAWVQFETETATTFLSAMAIFGSSAGAGPAAAIGNLAPQQEKVAAKMELMSGFKLLPQANTRDVKSDTKVKLAMMSSKRDATGKQTVPINLRIERGWRLVVASASESAGVKVSIPAAKKGYLEGSVTIQVHLEPAALDAAAREFQLQVQATNPDESLPVSTLRFAEIYRAEAHFDMAGGVPGVFGHCRVPDPAGKSAAKEVNFVTGYALIVEDGHGFANIPPARRALKLIDEDAPSASLLRDSFSDSSGLADFDLEGLPVIIGGQIRIPYECSSRYGLGKAQVLYRVLRKHESGAEPAEEEDWIKGPLPEVPADPNPLNPFNPKTGVFVRTQFDEQVEFHAVPSPNPDQILGRTQGGGRYFLKTTGLLDRKSGKALKLKSGDQIEYCIKVFAAHREPEASTPFFISESRVSTVMELKEFEEWRRQVSKEDERLKELEAKQKGVFGPK